MAHCAPPSATRSSSRSARWCCSFVLGFGVALLLASDDLWGKSFFRSVLILPYVISPVVVGVSFRLMMHPILGVLNYVLGTPGRDWLGSPASAMSSVIAITVWELTPFFAIILLAGLLSLPREPYEAARLDGAGDILMFRYLTLPLLRPVCQVALLMGRRRCPQGLRDHLCHHGWRPRPPDRGHRAVHLADRLPLLPAGLRCRHGDRAGDRDLIARLPDDARTERATGGPGLMRHFHPDHTHERLERTTL